MARYTVRQLARLAGVSVRTLHHYDAIGLLAPRLRTAAGYRIYGRDELLRLQQILLLRELEMPLHEIRAVLDAESHDPLALLEQHRRQVEARLGHLHRLLETIDTTIAWYRGERPMLSDDELYEGLPRETAARYRREARQRYGEERVAAVEHRVRGMGRAQWQATRQEWEQLMRRLAELMHLSPEAAEVQRVVAGHHGWLERNFYAAPADLYRGLGELYAGSPDFRAVHEAFRPGLADFLCAAMARFAGDLSARVPPPATP